MRNITVMNWISIDGFYAGKNGEIDWMGNDPEVDKAIHEMGGGNTGALLFGRITYQEMEAVWPNVAADPNAPAEAKAMAKEVIEMTKVVFSNTLKEVTWENSQLISGNLVEEVRKLRASDGPGLLIFGSGGIVRDLTDAGMIDDYVLIVTPVVLGEGKSQFQGANRVNLEFVESKTFASGNVVLHYKRA